LNRTTLTRWIATVAVLAVTLTGVGALASPAAASAAVEEPGAPTVGALKLDRVALRDEWIGGSVEGSTGYPQPVFTARGLPRGMKIDADGFVSGTIEVRGKFAVTVTATNASGSASRMFTVKVYDEGHQNLAITFPGKSTKLTTQARKTIKIAARNMPSWAISRATDIRAVMHYTGNYKKDLAKAKARAYAIASYLKKVGVTAKPTYSYWVDRKLNTAHSGRSFSEAYFSYTY